MQGIKAEGSSHDLASGLSSEGPQAGRTPTAVFPLFMSLWGLSRRSYLISTRVD